MKRCGPVGRATSTGATDNHEADRVALVTHEERVRRYAELAVRLGANVQPGQDVVVFGLVEHVEIARAVIREAYRAGASHVIVVYSDLHRRRAAIELGPEEEVGWTPPYVLDWIRRWPTENPALVSLTGNPDPDLLSDLDPVLVGRADPREERLAYLENIRGRHINWVIVAAPNEGWARQVFGVAGRRASLDGRGQGHATRRSRSGGGVAEACREAQGASPLLERAELRRDSVPWRGH